jgi:hypothetical protein
MGFWENLARKKVARENQRDVPDNWTVEVNDILGRWDQLDGSDVRGVLSAKGVLIHHWPNDKGLKYDEIIRLLQAMLDYDVFNCTGSSRKFKNRPLRIKNLGTGDFIMLEALGLKANLVVDEDVLKADTLAQAQMQQWGGTSKVASPMIPIKSLSKRPIP